MIDSVAPDPGLTSRRSGPRPSPAQARYVGGRGLRRSGRDGARGRRRPSIALDLLRSPGPLATLAPLLAHRRLVAAAGCALVALVALAGLLAPAPAPAAAADTASLFAATPKGPDFMDLGAKGILVLILLGVTLRVLRHLQAGPHAAGSNLVVLESRALAPKASLHLVAVGGRRIVVGLTPGGMVALAELGAGDLAANELVEAGVVADNGVTDQLAASRAARRSSTPAVAGLPVPAAFQAAVARFLGTAAGRS